MTSNAILLTALHFKCIEARLIGLALCIALSLLHCAVHASMLGYLPITAQHALYHRTSHHQSRLRFGARNQRRENLLAAGAGVVPERQGELVIDRQPLVVADELQTATIDRSIHRRIPTLRSDTNIGQEGRATIH